MGEILVTKNQPVTLSPDSTVISAFDALRGSIAEMTTNFHGSDKYRTLGDRTSIRIPTAPDPEQVGWVDEGAEIPESQTQLKELVIPTRKLASLKIVSNELARSSEGEGMEILLGHVTESVLASADKALYGSETAADGQLVGLSALDGVTEATITNSFDPITDAVANVIANYGKEQEIVMVAHPKAWAALTKIKENKTSARPLSSSLTGNVDFLLPNPGELDALNGGRTINVRTLNGIPLFMTPHIADGTLLLYDRSNVSVGADPVRFDRDNSYAFSRDATAMRSVYRLGWKVHKPNRITKFTVQPG